MMAIKGTKMRNLIEKLLARLGCPTRAEREDLVRQLGIAQAFARQVAEPLDDKAVIVGSDDVVLPKTPKPLINDKFLF